MSDRLTLALAAALLSVSPAAAQTVAGAHRAPPQSAGKADPSGKSAPANPAQLSGADFCRINTGCMWTGRFQIFNYSGNGVVSPRSNPVMQIVGTPASQSDQEVNFDAFAYNGFIQYDAERYDLPTFSPVANHEKIGVYSFEPFDGVSDSNTAEITAIATQNQSQSLHAHGTALYINYTPNNSTVLRQIGVAISPQGNGGVVIGGAFGHITDYGPGTLNVTRSVVTGNHYSSSGAAPTVSNCGTSASVSGTDNAGTIGMGAARTCTLTFHQAWASTPVCIVQTKNKPAPTAYVSLLSTSSMTISLTAKLDGSVYYICQGVGGV